MNLIVPNDFQQNLDLALQVLIASDAPIPTKLKSLNAHDLVQSQVALFMFCETLRQMQKLDEIKKESTYKESKKSTPESRPRQIQ